MAVAKFHPGARVDFDEYQKLAHKTARSNDVEVFTLGLFGEADSVATSIKKLKRDNEAQSVVKEEIATELGDVLWYLAEIANLYGLNLSEIARHNLEKTEFLFKGDDVEYDDKAPEDQKLPRRASVEFLDSDNKAVITVDNVCFGDPLDDNAHDRDDYRFHDIFHLAYMARLGWSPVIRKLLGRKRRYNSDIDRVEDGARAIFLEEGISVFVFNQNSRTPEGVSAFSDRRNIPFNVLSTIKAMTKGVEVGSRDISAWRDAIAMGFRIFDQIVQHGGGKVIVDLDKRKLTFQTPK